MEVVNRAWTRIKGYICLSAGLHPRRVTDYSMTIGMRLICDSATRRVRSTNPSPSVSSSRPRLQAALDSSDSRRNCHPHTLIPSSCMPGFKTRWGETQIIVPQWAEKGTAHNVMRRTWAPQNAESLRTVRSPGYGRIV